MRLNRHPQLFEAIFGGLLLRLRPDLPPRIVLGQPPALPGPFPFPAPPRGVGGGGGTAWPAREVDLLI